MFYILKLGPLPKPGGEGSTMLMHWIKPVSPVERRDSPGNWQLSSRRGARSFQASGLAVKKQNQIAPGNGRD